MALHLQAFIYLQLLDFLTTIVGFRLGLSEASPFIRLLMDAGPAAGILLSKLVAVALLGACLWLKRHRVIHWINYWYAGLVLWNLFLILTVLSRPAAA